ncbi:hypothetical protein ACFFJN_21395, partial [Erwinia mallotivora]|uniref:hypothetical protein n=1 Tax=Erwinia mallotivora TaxID=69222 RepID=UPI0035EB4FD2
PEFIANLPFTACHTLPSEIIVMHYTITPFGMSSKQQSGIHSTEDVNIKVGGNMDLAGSHIFSDSQSGSMDVAGSINVTDIKDSVDSGGVSAGGGGGRQR